MSGHRDGDGAVARRAMDSSRGFGHGSATRSGNLHAQPECDPVDRRVSARSWLPQSTRPFPAPLLFRSLEGHG